MQIAETAKFLIEQLGGEKAVISIETHPAGDGIRNNEDVSIRFAAWDKQPHRDEINLEITGLTAGYNGTGPRNLPGNPYVLHQNHAHCYAGQNNPPKQKPYDCQTYYHN